MLNHDDNGLVVCSIDVNIYYMYFYYIKIIHGLFTLVSLITFAYIYFCTCRLWGVG